MTTQIRPLSLCQYCGFAAYPGHPHCPRCGIPYAGYRPETPANTRPNYLLIATMWALRAASAAASMLVVAHVLATQSTIAPIAPAYLIPLPLDAAAIICAIILARSRNRANRINAWVLLGWTLAAVAAAALLLALWLAVGAPPIHPQPNPLVQ